MRRFFRLLFGVAMSALGLTQAAGADDAVFYTATYVEVVPRSAAEGAALLRQRERASRQDPGTASGWRR
jgi:hypothetical protein